MEKTFEIFEFLIFFQFPIESECIFLDERVMGVNYDSLISQEPLVQSKSNSQKRQTSIHTELTRTHKPQR